MSKTALLALNSRTGKWEASFAGRVIVQSPDKKYVKHVIEKGLNGKARELGITKVEELGSPTVEGQAPVPMVEFDINERFVPGQPSQLAAAAHQAQRAAGSVQHGAATPSAQGQGQRAVR